MSQHKFRICPLCEATCGLELELAGREVRSVRGDPQDPFSEGYLCPKGVALGDLDADPDRLRAPRIRQNGSWRDASWDEALEHTNRHLRPLLDAHGPHCLGLYLGNPTVHNLALSMYVPALRAALQTANVFTASSVDQLPKQLVVGLMFGHGMSVPIPDIDRCDHLLVLGANPLVSNGSLMTAPNVGQRLRRLRARGGRLVVFDPCRTRTAREADAHHFIRPGTDALLLFAMVHTIFAEELTAAGRLRPLVAGWDQVRALAQPFSPERVAHRCGVAPEVIRETARGLARAQRAAVYGRIGTCSQSFGTLASWLVEVLHVLTGNLDREGGAMFTRPAHGPANTKGTNTAETIGQGRGLTMGRWRSRVRGRPEIFGELPVACLAEEIETPGTGQIRAMIVIAGNPLLSGPHSGRLAKAWESLDFRVCLDLYPNETSRHADVLLPGLSPLECPHYDLIFSQLAIHNHARFSPPVYPPPAGHLAEWETVLRLAGIGRGLGPHADIDVLDDQLLRKMIRRETRLANSPIAGRDPESIVTALGPHHGPLRMLDFLLHTGPYGEAFGNNSGGLNLSLLEQHPHGIDLGPLGPRLPEILRTPSGKIELAPEQVLADVPRLQGLLQEPAASLVLIGRRSLRSNNSWMHNLPKLVSGKNGCTLRIHPNDARGAGLKDQDQAVVRSDVGEICLPVEVTDDLMPGVVSIPHGWGHEQSGQQIARRLPGVNSNLLADDARIDEPSGNAILNGILVTIE